MIAESKMKSSFFDQDVLTVAPALLGKVLVRRFDDGRIVGAYITETEAYRGEEDLACHARFGRTKRTEVMYHPGGKIYVYLIYGMYWMLNLVTSVEDDPQAVLIRSVQLEDGTKVTGPGRVGKLLQLDKSFYGKDITDSSEIWMEDGLTPTLVNESTRVGIAYAGEWAEKPWRWCATLTL